MSSHATYAADYAEDRSRLTTFFRYVLAIPHIVLLAIYGIGLAFAVIAAWFSIVITGRYPEGLHAFVSGVLQYIARVSGYVGLLTDAYPPFGPGPDDRHPVRLEIAPPLAEYDRLKTAFRLILMIPVYVIAYVLQLVGFVATAIAWFWIVITGRQNEALQSAIVLAQSYTMRAYTYYCLLTETWPPFTSETPVSPSGGGTLEAPESAGILPAGVERAEGTTA